MKVLVTGGTGFVGSHLVEALLARNYEVHCLVRPESNRRWLGNLPVKYIQGDLTDKAFLKEAVKGFDYLYHIAGLIKAHSFADYDRVNAQLTADLIEAVTKSNPTIKRFLHLSSLAVTGPAPDISGVDEDAPCCPVSDYGRTKLKGEEALKPYFNRVRITILRPPPVFGPRDDGLLIYFKAISWRLVPRFYAGRYVSMVYVGDLVDAIIRAAGNDAAAGNTYFIANQNPYAINYLSQLIKEGVIKSKISCPVWLPDVLIKGLAAVSEGLSYVSGRPSIFNSQKALELTQNYWVCRTDRARRDFQWQATTPVGEAMAQTAGWYRAQGWI